MQNCKEGLSLRKALFLICEVSLNLIILHPWFKKDDYRWQYTAITRGEKRGYSY
jgi:hypothetical protein